MIARIQAELREANRLEALTVASMALQVALLRRRTPELAAALSAVLREMPAEPRS